MSEARLALSTFRLENALVVTMNDDRAIVRGAVDVVDGRIVAVGTASGPSRGPTIDCGGDVVMPGLVQAHVHLCQTLFRNQAEDRVLLRWLRERIWPLEGAHTPETLAVSAELGIGELLRSGTTCLLDMGTVHHQDAVAETVAASGIRAMIGKAMMDAGEGVPATLLERTTDSLDESLRQARRWHGFDGDRVRYAFAPRFVLSCTAELQREVGRLSALHGYGVHTHASEQVEEVALVERLTGMRNVEYLESLGLCSPRAVFAHCVHVDGGERATLARTGTSVCHCPSSNLKLGSGIADVVRLRASGVNVALGADGAPCNNGLDGMLEARLAHLLQCATNGPGSLPAADALWLATRGGARALGWDSMIGSVEPGKDADLVRVRRGDFRSGSGGDADVYEELVCAGGRDLVRDVWVRGVQLVSAGELTRLDAAALAVRGRAALRDVVERSGVV
ncbi:MAG: amidohydrolase family protein [Myxococcales bacterium]|nr:amidohydrolase family protein [Myxococcales bacterium]MCB9532393.1 amidohydrolase family protein [Myxococcales bacterium]